MKNLLAWLFPWRRSHWLAMRLTLLEVKLDFVANLLLILNKKGDTMSKEFADLVAAVHAETDVKNSVLAALAGLAQQVADLAAAGGTPEQFAALAQTIKDNNAAMTAAVLNVTPPAPPAPAPVPEPTPEPAPTPAPEPTPTP